LGQPPVLFDLYVTYQRLGELLDQALAGSRIAPDDAPLYNQLERAGELTPGALGRLLGVKPSTLTYRLARLERRGDVKRSRNPVDGRSTLVRLTPRGLAAWRRVLPQFVGALQAVERRIEVPLEDVESALRAVRESVEHELVGRARSPGRGVDPRPRDRTRPG
jgi:DNA-binding MarR family transcriptional regulator